MGSQHVPIERIEALRELLRQLSAPDLTLADANLLRGRLCDLLERDGKPVGWDRMAPTMGPVPHPGQGDRNREDLSLPGTSIPAAGDLYAPESASWAG